MTEDSSQLRADLGILADGGVDAFMGAFQDLTFDRTEITTADDQGPSHVSFRNELPDNGGAIQLLVDRTQGNYTIQLGADWYSKVRNIDRKELLHELHELSESSNSETEVLSQPTDPEPWLCATYFMFGDLQVGYVHAKTSTAEEELVHGSEMIVEITILGEDPKVRQD